MKTTILILTVLLTAAAVWAVPDGDALDIADTPMQPPVLERLRPLRFDIGAGFIGSSDLKDAEGSVTTTRVLAQLGALLPVAENDRTQGIALNLRLVDSFFDFDDAGGFEPGTDDPFGEMRLIRLSALFRKQVDPEFSWFAGLGIDSAGERRARFSDTLRYSFFGATSWQIEENLTLGIGALVDTRLGGGWRFFAIPILDWRISDDWRLRTEARLDRFSVIASYDISDAFSIGAVVGYFGQRYRLEDDGPLAGGFFEEERFFAGITAEWKVSPAFSVIGALGAQVSGSFELEDRDGRRKAGTDLGAAPIAELGIELRF